MADTPIAIPFKNVITDPKLTDLVNEIKRDIMLNLNCHAIATVQGVDYAKKTVTASINYSQTYLNPQANGVLQAKQVPYPILLDCPFVIISGGTAGLLVPINIGDQCLMLFNDRSIDNWVAGATTGPPSGNRTHSLADGIALVGLNFSGTIDPLRIRLQKDSTYVGVSASHVKIANSTTTLNTLLAQLITVLDGLIIDVSAVGPGSGTVSAASQLALNNVKTLIAGLLE